MSRVLSIDQVAELAWGVGLRGEPLAVAVAVAKGESGFNAHAVGDEALQDAKWGPSLGLWQVRSLKAAYLHLEPIRDASKLKDPAYNAKAMYRISGGGNNFGPWSVFTSGAYRNHLQEARRAAARQASGGGSGSNSGGGGSSDVPTGESPDVTVEVGSLPLRYKEPRRTDNIVLAGVNENIYLADYVIGGSVDLAATQVSEVTIDLDNPDLWAGQKGARHGARMWWDGLRMEVAALEIRQGDGGPQLRTTCRSVVAQQLKKPGGSVGLEVHLEGKKNLSPTEYVHKQIRSVTDTRYFGFIGEGSARRSDITPLTGPDGAAETPWDVIQRLADELGYLAFEAGDVFCFGRPTWLVARGVEVKVGWRNAWNDDRLDALELPTIRRTATDDDPVTMSCKLPRWRGEQVRPGMRLVLKGVYGVPTEYLVTGVQWPIDGGIEPVTVDAVQPINPAPTLVPDADPASGGGGGGGTGGGTPSPGPSGRRISQDQRITHFGQPGDTSRITTYKTPWGITVSVHKAVRDRFAAACADADRASSWRPRRIDSYNKRAIRGGTQWSFHSWALAWDFFSSAPGVPPPGGVWSERSAPDAAFRAAFKAQGFYLGADFTSRKDYPHIEWADFPPNATANQDGDGSSGAHRPGGGPLE